METLMPYLVFSLPAVPASVRRARASVGKAAAGFGASERVVEDIRLCVSEAVSNSVRHAYGAQSGEIQVAIERDNGDLVVVVRDEGQGMKLAKPRGTVGGYGLKIINSAANRLTISSAGTTGTEVRMKFALPVGALR